MSGCTRSLTPVLLLALAQLAMAQEVTLPLDRFEDLRARANPSPTPTPPPAAPWALESATVKADVGATSAQVVTTLVLSLFASDWQDVTLAPVGRLLAVDLGGLQGRVAAGDAWVLHVKGAGRHTLRLESVIDVEEDQHAARPERDALIRLPAGVVCTGLVKVDPSVEEVVFEGATAAGRGAGGEWNFVGQPSRELKARLLGKAIAPERQKLPLRFLTQTSSLATVGRTRTRLRVWLATTIRQGELDTLKVRVPEGFRVVSVGGDPLGGWDVKAGVLAITPATPSETSFAVELGLTADAMTELPSPLVLPLDAARATLVSAVQVEGDGLLELAAAGSGRVPEERERRQLPAGFRSEARFPMVVTDPARPPRWSISWPEKGEVLAAQVDRLVVDALLGESGEAAYQCWAEVRNAGATSLTLTMPAGFELVEANRDGVRVSAGAAGLGGLVVPLSASSAAQVVHVSGVLRLAVPDKDETFSVPVPALSAPVGRVEFRLGLPPGRSYRAKAVESADSVEPPIPRASGPASGNVLAQQVQSVAAAEPSRGVTTFATPPGFVLLLGRWSALSAKPGVIQVQTEIVSSKWGWF